MYSTCVTDCSSDCSSPDGLMKNNNSISLKMKSKLKLLGRAAQYRLSMLLLRWNISDIDSLDDDGDLDTLNADQDERNEIDSTATNCTDARRKQISTAVRWLKILAKIEGNDREREIDIDLDSVAPGVASVKGDVIVALAAHAVATMYTNGIVSPMDPRDSGTSSRRDNLNTTCSNKNKESEFTGRAILQPDITVATKWFRTAAVAGNGSAAFNLASMYEEGRGVKIDAKMARVWYECAARLLLSGSNGSNGSSENIGNSGSTKHFSSSDGWLSSFDSEREYNLGVLYMTGRGFGMLSNSKEAMRWLKRASLHRHCDAMHALAWSLLQQQSHKEALRVLYQAAKEGHEPSSEAVATMYQRGMGVIMNRKKSSSWFEIAGEQRQMGLRAETMLWRLGNPCFYQLNQ